MYIVCTGNGDRTTERDLCVVQGGTGVSVHVYIVCMLEGVRMWWGVVSEGGRGWECGECQRGDGSVVSVRGGEGGVW